MMRELGQLYYFPYIKIARVCLNTTFSWLNVSFKLIRGLYKLMVSYISMKDAYKRLSGGLWLNYMLFNGIAWRQTYRRQHLIWWINDTRWRLLWIDRSDSTKISVADWSLRYPVDIGRWPWQQFHKFLYNEKFEWIFRLHIWSFWPQSGLSRSANISI